MGWWSYLGGFGGPKSYQESLRATRTRSYPSNFRSTHCRFRLKWCSRSSVNAWFLFEYIYIYLYTPYLHGKVPQWNNRLVWPMHWIHLVQDHVVMKSLLQSDWEDIQEKTILHTSWCLGDESSKHVTVVGSYMFTWLLGTLKRVAEQVS